MKTSMRGFKPVLFLGLVMASSAALQAHAAENIAMQYSGSKKEIPVKSVEDSTGGHVRTGHSRFGGATHEPLLVIRKCDADNAGFYDMSNKPLSRDKQPASLRIAYRENGKIVLLIKVDHPALVSVTMEQPKKEDKSGEQVCRMRFDYTSITFEDKAPVGKSYEDDWNAPI